MRLVGALLEEQTDEWQVTRRDMSQESLARVVGGDDIADVLTDDRAVA